jgi:hypothetical protein
MTRLVLWTLSKHMGMDGVGAFPNQETIARESGIGLRTVKEHLEYAVEAGWIERTPKRKGSKRSYRFGTEYLPRFPCTDFNGAPGALLNPLPPSRERRRLKKAQKKGGSAPGANEGASGTRMVHPAATSTSRNSSRESSCL